MVVDVTRTAHCCAILMWWWFCKPPQAPDGVDPLAKVRVYSWVKVSVIDPLDFLFVCFYTGATDCAATVRAWCDSR